MKFRLLGRSGLRASGRSLGAMTFGLEFEHGVDRDESRKVFDAYAEAGGNFIDTANFYTAGTSERFLGEFLGAERDRFVIATKYSICTRPGDLNAGGNHRKNLMQSVEASLKRLNTEYIDLLWLHAWDFMTPVDEVMRGLDDLVRAGKVFYVGISDAPAWIVSQSNTMADLRGWTPFLAIQIQYSLIDRTPERDLLPMARVLDLGVATWGSLGAGLLTGQYNRDPQSGDKRRLEKSPKVNERNLGIAAEVIRVAGEIGCLPSHVALNWLLRQPAQIIPIVGAKTVAQLKENLRCLDFDLD